VRVVLRDENDRTGSGPFHNQLFRKARAMSGWLFSRVFRVPRTLPGGLKHHNKAPNVEIALFDPKPHTVCLRKRLREASRAAAAGGWGPGRIE